MTEFIIAFVPFDFKADHAKIRLTKKVFGNKSNFHTLGIFKTAAGFQLHIFKIGRNDLGHITAMRIKKIADAEFSASMSLLPDQAACCQFFIAAGPKIILKSFLYLPLVFTLQFLTAFQHGQYSIIHRRTHFRGFQSMDTGNG